MNENQIQNSLESCALRIEHGAKITVDGIMQAGRALKEARNLFGENDKAFGQWREQRLPWLKTFTATRYLQAYEKFGEKLLQHNVGVEIGATVIYELSAPSTPDPVVAQAMEKAESGEKVSVEDVKRWKAEAEAARRESQKHLELADALGDDLQKAREKVKYLESLPPSEVIKTVEVVPVEFRNAKANLEKAKAEAEKARAEAAAAKSAIEKLKAQQEKTVDEKFSARLKLHQSELKDLEERKELLEKAVEKAQQQKDKMDSKLSRIKYHEDEIKAQNQNLMEFSSYLSDFDHCPETESAWLKLAANFENAASAIKHIHLAKNLSSNGG